MNRCKANPSFECVSEERCRTTECQFQQNASHFNSDELSWTNGHENHQMAIQSDSSTFQPGIHRQEMTLEGQWHKTCHWFDEIEEPTDTHATLSPSQTNRSTRSLHKFYRRVKSQSWQQVSPTDVCGLTVQETEESEFEFTPPQSLTASHKSSQTFIEVCFPPGCIPSNMIIQATGEKSESVARAKATTTIKQNDGLELDSWVKDICNQASTLENFSGPGISCAPVESGVSIVLDLEEDILAARREPFCVLDVQELSTKSKRALPPKCNL